MNYPKAGIISVIIVVALGLAACSSNATNTPSSSTAASAKKVAVLSEAAEGDPWADLVAKGATEGADGATVKRIAGIQTTAIDQQIRSVASSGSNPVVVLQDNMATSVAKLAASFPGTHFVVVDSLVADKAPNVTSITIDASNTAYLAGAVAGLVSASTTLGFVGGADVPIIGQFLCGFTAGAKSTAPKDEITTVYAGSFTDPTKGKNLATQLYNSGVDVVFQAAALTGLGVLKAAASTGKQAIGVDTWQGDVAPGHVAWNALKDGAGATAYAVKNALASTLKSGALVWDSTKGAKLYDDRDLAALPAADQEKVKEIAQGLQDGSIVTSCK